MSSRVWIASLEELEIFVAVMFAVKKERRDAAIIRKEKLPRDGTCRLLRATYGGDPWRVAYT